MFAISDTVWLAIIGLIALLIKEYFDRRRATAVSDKVEIVATDIRKVEIATNSMKDALVLATEKEALARGGKEERERAETEKREAS